jgi:hypothetical protein
MYTDNALLPETLEWFRRLICRTLYEVVAAYYERAKNNFFINDAAYCNYYMHIDSESHWNWIHGWERILGSLETNACNIFINY